ncbi:cleft lip and palate transmembrane protein 1 (clptm1), putative [Entamoeba histolytica HM-1:IMSS-B]|nr:cleft lip and palate transmembrane protein 1 (clptm1), putative [Entamoeba histolytica HM-1:IMSS-B]
MVEQPAPSNNRNNQQQLSFIQKHPLAACLIVVFIAYSCYGIYSTIYPPTNGYKSAYMDNEHIYFNVSLIHQSQEHHLLSKDVEYKNIDSLSEPISIPSNYLSYIKSNQSIIMKVVVKPLTKYNNQSMTFKSPILRTFKPIPQTHNLINENNITTTTNELNFTLGCIPYFEISFMKQIVDPHNIPPECGIVHYNGIKKRIAPIIFHNTFWLIKDYYTPINDTIQNLNISLKITSISYFKMIMIHSLGHSFSIHQHMGTMVHDEIDEFKRVFMETNIILLVITTIVSTLHTIFDFLAYKNDIQFWSKRNNFAGLSIKSIFVSLGIEIIVLLYLIDNDTSFLILISNGVGLLITLWKLTRVFTLNFKEKGSFIQYKNLSYQNSKTKLYDDIALKYLGIACIPLCIGYAIYSLYNNEFKSWYSYILSLLVGVVYTFGFLQMTPQLFINYKLKSVANLPWRVFIYKFLNTIVDDLFAFIIKMPTLHRIACFRDDIIFLIYLYQRWIYPVDKNRMDSLQWEDDEPMTLKDDNSSSNFHEKQE